jgi:hypothetical protein
MYAPRVAPGPGRRAPFKCKLDAKPWAACSSPKSYANLSRGRHTFKVKAIDKAGNEDASPASKSWRIT